MTQWGEITHLLKKEVLQIWKRWSMELDKYGKKWHIWNYWTHCNLARCEMIWNINMNPKVKGVHCPIQERRCYKYEKMIHGYWINMARNEKYEIIGPKEVLVKFEMIWNINMNPKVKIVHCPIQEKKCLQIWKEMTNGNWINMARYEENVGIWPWVWCDIMWNIKYELKLINTRLPLLVWKLFTVDDDNG